MSQHVVPHFHNTSGAASIEIGVREFMCIGAEPPFDHPHVFLDMGHGDDIVCPYCSTHYRYNAELTDTETRPAGHLLTGAAA